LRFLCDRRGRKTDQPIVAADEQLWPSHACSHLSWPRAKCAGQAEQASYARWLTEQLQVDRSPGYLRPGQIPSPGQEIAPKASRHIYARQAATFILTVKQTMMNASASERTALGPPLLGDRF